MGNPTSTLNSAKKNITRAAGRTYLQTETREISNWRDVTNARTVHPADASGDVDFLFERQTLDLRKIVNTGLNGSRSGDVKNPLTLALAFP